MAADDFQKGSPNRRGDSCYREGAIRIERPATSCRRALGGRGTGKDKKPIEALPEQQRSPLLWRERIVTGLS